MVRPGAERFWLFNKRYRYIVYISIVLITVAAFLLQRDDPAQTHTAPGVWRQLDISDPDGIAITESGFVIISGNEVTLMPEETTAQPIALHLNDPVRLLSARGDYYAIASQTEVLVNRWPAETLYTVSGPSNLRAYSISVSTNGSIAIVWSIHDMGSVVQIVGPDGSTEVSIEKPHRTVLVAEYNHGSKALVLGATEQKAAPAYTLSFHRIDSDHSWTHETNSPVHHIAYDPTVDRGVAVCSSYVYVYSEQGIDWSLPLPHGSTCIAAPGHEGALLLTTDTDQGHAVLSHYRSADDPLWESVIGGSPGSIYVNPDGSAFVVSSHRVAMITVHGIPKWDQELPGADPASPATVITADTHTDRACLVLDSGEVWVFTRTPLGGEENSGSHP